MRKKGLSATILIALLGTWSVLFRQISFPLLPAAPFLKMDLSDIPVLMGLMSGGPVGAISVAFVRDCIDFLIKGGEMGLPIGALMSFFSTLSFYLPLHYYFKSNKRKNYLIFSICSIGLLVIVASLLNYFIALPLYIKLFKFPIENIKAYILAVIIPFNLIKGVILSIVSYLLIPMFNKLIKGRPYKYYQQMN